MENTKEDYSMCPSNDSNTAFPVRGNRDVCLTIENRLCPKQLNKILTPINGYFSSLLERKKSSKQLIKASLRGKIETTNVTLVSLSKIGDLPCRLQKSRDEIC